MDALNGENEHEREDGDDIHDDGMEKTDNTKRMDWTEKKNRTERTETIEMTGEDGWLRGCGKRRTSQRYGQDREDRLDGEVERDVEGGEKDS